MNTSTVRKTKLARRIHQFVKETPGGGTISYPELMATKPPDFELIRLRAEKQVLVDLIRRIHNEIGRTGLSMETASSIDGVLA